MAAVGFNETVESQDEINVLWEEAYQAARELLGIAHLSAGSLMVVGCSTSEVAGERIELIQAPSLPKQYLMVFTQLLKRQEFIWQPSAASI